MKKFAQLLTGIAIVVVLFIVYYIFSSRLVTHTTVSVIPARERVEDFGRVQQDVAGGLYENLSALNDIGDYSFVTIEVKAKNYSLFTAEWAVLTARYVDSDVLLFAQDGGPKDIGAFGTGTFSVTLLTRSTNSRRSGLLEYYTFGRLHWLDVAPE